MTAVLLSLLIGLLLGYWGWVIFVRVNKLYEYWKDRMESPAGVVRPVGTPTTRGQPIDMSSETGRVSRPTPEQVENDRQIERDRILRENHQ